MWLIKEKVSSANMESLNLNILSNRIKDNDFCVKELNREKDENIKLKQDLLSMKESAMQMKELYELELKKNQDFFNIRNGLESEINSFKQKISQIEDERINAIELNKQTIAGLEDEINSSKSKKKNKSLNVYKQFLNLGDILHENGLLVGSVKKRFTHFLDFFKDEGLDVAKYQNMPKSPKKKIIQTRIEVSPMTPKRRIALRKDSKSDQSTQSPEVSIKYFTPSKNTTPTKTVSSGIQTSDQSSMTYFSTTTRGTSTSTFIQKVDVCTMFPEVLPISFEEIFTETIVRLPLLSPIDEILCLAKEMETQTGEQIIIKEMKDAETITNLSNIRKKIDYCKKRIPSPNSFMFENLKKESISPSVSMNNLDSFTEPFALNPQLANLWSLLGHSIFSIIGNGRIADHDKILQIHKAIENEARKEDSNKNSLNFKNELLRSGSSSRDSFDFSHFSRSEDEIVVPVVEKEAETKKLFKEPEVQMEQPMIIEDVEEIIEVGPTEPILVISDPEIVENSPITLSPKLMKNLLPTNEVELLPTIVQESEDISEEFQLEKVQKCKEIAEISPNFEKIISLSPKVLSVLKDSVVDENLSPVKLCSSIVEETEIIEFPLNEEITEDSPMDGKLIFFYIIIFFFDTFVIVFVKISIVRIVGQITFFNKI